MKNSIIILASVVTMFTCENKNNEKLLQENTQSYVMDSCLDTIETEKKMTAPTIKKLSSRLKKMKQYYEINLSCQDYITTKQGSIIAFPKNCILDNAGKPVTSKVDVEIIELNTREDFVKSGITTVTTDNKLLVSGGFYYLNVTKNGRVLKINPHKKVLALFSSRKVDSNMKYFRGNVSNTHQDVQWQLVSNTLYDSLPTSNDFRYPYVRSELEKEIARITTKIANFYKAKELVDCFFYDISDRKRYLSLRNNSYFIHFGRCNGGVPSGNIEAYKVFDAEKLVNSHKNKINNLIATRELLLDSLVKTINNVVNKLLKGNLKSSFYITALDNMGWMNIDKFYNKEMTTITGNISKRSNPTQEVQIHLLSSKELIHIKKTTRNHKFTFQFPKNMPYELLIDDGNKVLRKKFDVKNENLEPIIIS